MGHQAIPVKVTAWVDEGVAALVTALNDFDGVMTLDSCEGAEHGAYVIFRCQEGDPVRFAADLGSALKGCGEQTEFLLRAEWRPGADEPLLELACPPDHAERLAAAVSAFRTRAFSGGRPRIGCDSSRADRSRQPIPQ